eukprot:TRINITY_DN5446_c0_g1_i1.p1 TRINITY_DN5446_c0_g1~~TRINITY_DN5446_c0_g1_i1.p1  ORF type:complete len:163 (+),score=40.97 TRINITY_DN5446_c0_g1_i1:78-566(+)
MALRRTALRLLDYAKISASNSMYTTTNRFGVVRQMDYQTNGTINGRTTYWYFRRERPWWKEMPKYGRPNGQKHWFEPLPADNYLHHKCDGLYQLPAGATLTLQHVLHLRMMPVKMMGRTFTMPLVRWMIGARTRNIVGSGRIKEEPVYKLTKPKYWAKGVGG